MLFKLRQKGNRKINETDTTLFKLNIMCCARYRMAMKMDNKYRYFSHCEI